MVTYAPDEVGLADKSPCAGIRADLKICLLASDCCKKVSILALHYNPDILNEKL